MTPPARFSSSALGGVTAVTDAVGLHRDGAAPLIVVVALEGGGLASFTFDASGAAIPGATALPGMHVTGLATAHLDSSGAEHVVAVTADKKVYALDGSSLRTLWTASVSALSAAGAIVPGDQDGDGDEDVAVLSDDFQELISLESRASGWVNRDQVGLPPDILGVAAGPLGGNKNDEYLFMGVGGLVEAVTIGGFNYVDDRVLSATSHVRAAFADLDGDGKGDVAITTPGEVELWKGDGKAGITIDRSLTVGPAAIQDLAVLPGGTAGASLLVVDHDGSLWVLEAATGAIGIDRFTATDRSLRILAGDLDGDGDLDAVIIDRDGAVHEWRDPR